VKVPLVTDVTSKYMIAYLRLYKTVTTVLVSYESKGLCAETTRSDLLGYCWEKISTSQTEPLIDAAASRNI
jgi:hypothetical protein